MHLEGEEALPVPPARAWAALQDVDLLQRAIPGCESLTPAAEGENRYDVALAAAVGPVRARFAGFLQLADLDPPNGYTLQFEAKSPAGHGKGTARVSLVSAADGGSVLRYECDASVGGKLAQVGARLVDAAAQKIAGEFFERLTGELAKEAPVAQPEAAITPAAAARSSWLERLVAWWRGLTIHRTG